MQCEKCKSKWETDTGVLIETCPFCQTKLLVVDDRTPEQKMRFIGNKFEPDLYASPVDFCAVIDENFTDENDATARLLKFLINNNASSLVLTLKDLPLESVNQEANKIIDELNYNTFIPQDILTPAITLLCIGLGIENLIPINSNSSISDFKIENGKLKKYTGNANSVVIPKSVTSIGNGAFSGCTNLTEITIPDSVTVIGNGAFKDCTSLNQIDIPNSVTVIDSCAFKDCTNLSEIIIPNSVTIISGGAFSGCTSLSQIDIPNSVTVISVATFKNCTKLSKITIPNSVIRINAFAFQDCTALCEITTLNAVTEIGNGVFSGCTNLPESIKMQFVETIPHF